MSWSTAQALDLDVFEEAWADDVNHWSRELSISLEAGRVRRSLASMGIGTELIRAWRLGYTPKWNGEPRPTLILPVFCDGRLCGLIIMHNDCLEHRGDPDHGQPLGWAKNRETERAALQQLLLTAGAGIHIGRLSQSMHPTRDVQNPSAVPSPVS